MAWCTGVVTVKIMMTMMTVVTTIIITAAAAIIASTDMDFNTWISYVSGGVLSTLKILTIILQHNPMN